MLKRKSASPVRNVLNILNSLSNTPIFIHILGSLSEILHEVLDGLQDCLLSHATVRNEQRFILKLRHVAGVVTSAL